MIGAIQAPLFVPASRPDRFAKAAASGADAVILDLEDAVPSADKTMARETLDCAFTTLPILVRVNAHGTPWFAADIAAIRRQGFGAVILPKSEDPQHVAGVVSALDGVPVIALIESARGLAAARAVASVPGVVRLAFGSVDMSADMGCAHQRDVLLPTRSELVLASRLAGLAAPLDGVTLQLADMANTRDDARHARAVGMGGKMCIHPRQVAEVLDAFRPDPVECAWAEQVLKSGEGAVSVGGQMVDEPVRIRARSILAAAGRRA